MDRIRRNERLAAMTRILVESPNKIFTLGTFCEMFGAAKSTLSEDIDILRGVFAQFHLGQLDTVTGAAGGVRYRPVLAPEDAYRTVKDLAQMLAAPGRVLPGGFIYMADILAMPEVVERMGVIIASQFYRAEPDFVLTMETKGIPIAMMTARALGVPTVIVRRDSKVYEGPAVNINYLSGSGSRVETMSLSRRAVREGQRALIVDDFMRAGGTARGMVDMMREFSVTVVGVCVLISTKEPVKKRLDGVKSLLVIDETDESAGSANIHPANWLIQATGTNNQLFSAGAPLSAFPHRLFWETEAYMFIVVGLGNPGREYARTRHNVGFDVIDVLSEKHHIQLTKNAMHGQIGEGFVGGEKLVLVKPQTFMNLSGQCVTELVSWYKPEMDHLLLVYDDIDLPLGKLRMREKGSAGTHNGMRSVIGLLGRQDFPRLRVGVGKKPEGWELADWVLSHYQTEADRKTQFDAFLRAADVVDDLMKNGLESAMRMANAPA